MTDKSKTYLSFSEIESKRFGLKVYRGNIEDINPVEIVDFTLKEGVDVAIIRIPTKKIYCLGKLDMTGLPYIIADALVYYQMDLKNYNPNELKNEDLKFIETSFGHKEIVDKLVTDAFIEYRNHYSSNPLFDIDLVEAYKEWAQGYYLAKENGKCAWLVQRKDQFVGFATCAFAGDECEIILNGILPEDSGGGIYTDLIRFIQQFFKRRGYSVLKVSTQINNHAVQKVWNREGLFLNQSFFTIHINSLISASSIKKKIFGITVTNEDVIIVDETNGDLNPVNFDTRFTISKGLTGEIAHNLIFNTIILKYFGNEFPGPGTSIIENSNRFFKPIYLDIPYRFEITFPVVNYEAGFYKSLVKVFNSEREICFLSYYDLMKE